MNAAIVRPINPVEAAEAEAIELLRAAYLRDVAALAEALKARLLAGEFSGDIPGPLCEGGPIIPDMRNGFEDLEAICQTHRRASPEMARITMAVCPGRTMRVLTKIGLSVSDEYAAAFCLAYDVREHAIRHWRVPIDDYFGELTERKTKRAKAAQSGRLRTCRDDASPSRKRRQRGGAQ